MGAWAVVKDHVASDELIAQVGHFAIGIEQECHCIEVKVFLFASQQFAEEA